MNGTGETNVVSGVIGGEIQLTDRLRADLGGRVEYNDYVQSSENTGPVDLDGDPTTTFNNIEFGLNSFRHFTHNITDWAASLGVNYQLNDDFAVYAAGSRGYKMPALDELLEAQSQAQVDLFEAREIESVEGGVKWRLDRMAFTVNGFYLYVANQIGQGAELDSQGRTVWVIRENPGQPVVRGRAGGRRLAIQGAPGSGQRHPPPGGGRRRRGQPRAHRG